MCFSKCLFNLDWQIVLTPFQQHMQRLTLSLLMHLPFGPLDGIFFPPLYLSCSQSPFSRGNVSLSKIPSEYLAPCWNAFTHAFHVITSRTHLNLTHNYFGDDLEYSTGLLRVFKTSVLNTCISACFWSQRCSFQNYRILFFFFFPGQQECVFRTL